jgi:hypothetical protein
MKRNTAMRVITDGDDGLRNFVQRSSPRPVDSQLDWFHIGMKLELLRKAVVMPSPTKSILKIPMPLTRCNAVSRDCAMPCSEVDHGKRVSSSRGCAGTSTDGWPSTRPLAPNQFGAPNRSSKSFRYYMCGNR